MKKIVIFCLLFLACGSAGAVMVDTAQFGRFGKVVLYRTSPEPSNVVLFVSGDGGWNKGVVDMAIALAEMDSLVIGIDLPRYMKQLNAGKEKCGYPASDLEMLAQFVEKKLDFKTYHYSVIVGYSSGATLAYEIIAQAPPGSFVGAVSLGFCPDLDLAKPPCRGHGLESKPGFKGSGYIFLPQATLETPWIVLQGKIDVVCSPAQTINFVKKTGSSRIVLLPKVGHGYSVPANWMPQFKDAYAGLVNKQELAAKPQAKELSDLELVELPPRNPEGKLMAVIVTGDGGWVGIDKDIGNYLAAHDIPVVGLSSIRYFWTKKSPDQASQDLARILNYYLYAWKKEEAILIGYSRGADVIPFMAGRLPAELLEKVRLMVLLGPEKTEDFEFHFSDLIPDYVPTEDYQVLPEVQRLRGKKILCVYGEEETDSMCRVADPAQVILYETPDGHHFGSIYDTIAQRIIDTAK